MASKPPTIGYEPPRRGPSPAAARAFVSAALGAIGAFWTLLAVGFDVALSPRLVPIPPQAWFLAAGVVPSSIVGLAVGLLNGGNRYARLGVIFNGVALVVSGSIVGLAWIAGG